MSETEVDDAADAMLPSFVCKNRNCNGTSAQRHATKFRQPLARSESGKLYHVRVYTCTNCGRPQTAVVGVSRPGLDQG